MPKRLSKEIRKEIEVKALENLDGPQIEGHLEELMKEDQDGFDHVPNLRTIQQIMKKAKHEDSSGPWRLMDSSPDHIAVIMPVLADVHFRTKAQRRYLTKREAEVILKLRGASAFMTGFDIYMLARSYIFREERGEPTEDLDIFTAQISYADAYPESALERLEGESDARTHTQTG